METHCSFEEPPAMGKVCNPPCNAQKGKPPAEPGANNVKRNKNPSRGITVNPLQCKGLIMEIKIPCGARGNRYIY